MPDEKSAGESDENPAGEFVESEDPRFDAQLLRPKVWVRPVRRRPKKWEHTAISRRVLAWTIVATTLALYALLVVAVICHWIVSDTFVAILSGLAPLQALAAATVGFYFGRQTGEQ